MNSKHDSLQNLEKAPGIHAIELVDNVAWDDDLRTLLCKNQTNWENNFFYPHSNLACR